MHLGFEKCLEARWLWMEMRYLQVIPGYERKAEEAGRKAMHLVTALAESEATSPQFYFEAIPPLFEDEGELAQCYIDGYESARAWLDDIEYERQLVAERDLKTQRATECIAREAWDELDLPTPDALSIHLLSGKSITIEQHFLMFEADDGITWMDNPYGVEGCLGEIPTPELMRSFLIRVACGGMYGPEP